jgi:hypothetical protein
VRPSACAVITLTTKSVTSVPRIIHWPLFELWLCCSRSSLHLLTAAFGTNQPIRHICRMTASRGNPDIESTSTNDQL